MVNTNVTLNLLAFFVSSVKKDSRNPLLSIIPTPIKTIMMLITGDLSFVVLLPICARCFKYGKRNPKAGIFKH